MRVLGIDIAKATFTITLLSDGHAPQQGTFDNDEAGIARLLNWLKKRRVKQLHACMEATSIYWEEVAEALDAAGYRVSVVNPARIKGFAQSQLRREKNDPLDSLVIAQFCQMHQPDPWQPPTPAQRQLRDLMRHRDRLVTERTRLSNQRGSCRQPYVQQSLERLLTQVEQELAQLKAELERLVAQHPDLKRNCDLLCSIPGVGRITALTILAEMPHLRHYDDAKAAAADAGLTPSHFVSGHSVHRRPRLSKIGKAGLRAKLFFPAMTALRFNPLLKAFADRLFKLGKPYQVVCAAVMRKLLHLAYGVLKHQSPFDPHFATPSPSTPTALT